LTAHAGERIEPASMHEPSTAPVPSTLRVHGAILAVQVAFASLAVAGRVVLREMPAPSLVLVRLVGASLVFATLPVTTSRLSVPWRDRLGIAFAALLGIFGNQALFLLGLRSTTATHATLLVATIPIFTMIAAVLVDGERPSRLSLLGTAIAFVGVGYLVGAEALAIGVETLVGDLLVLGNAVIYGFYLVLVRPYVARWGSTVVVSWGFGFAALYAIPFATILPLLLPDLGSITELGALSGRTWALAFYIVLVPTVFTYITNAWALKHASPSTVAVWIYAQPTFAAVMAWFFLDEALTPRLLSAAALVFAGIGLVARGRATHAPLERATSGAVEES
jgi:drug/metabolite transporter (DMT)-like permease